MTIGQNGGVLMGPARDTYLIPDLVVSSELLEPHRATLLPAEILLAVEVLSPRSRSIDLIMKRHQYARMGIPQYWIVDSTARALTVLRLDADNAYGRVTVVKAGECWRTDDPFPLALDPGDFG